MGPDHNVTLTINMNLAAALQEDPERTRDGLRLDQHDDLDVTLDLNTGDDLLEAVTIMQDVVKGQRQVFGPAHPCTLHAEYSLSHVRAQLAHA